MKWQMIKSPDFITGKIQLQNSFDFIFDLLFVPCVLFSPMLAHYIYINELGYKYLDLLDFISLGLPFSLITSSFITWFFYRPNMKEAKTLKRIQNTKYIRWFYICNNVFRIIIIFSIITRVLYAAEAFLFYPSVHNLYYVGLSTWHVVVFGCVLLISLKYAICLIPAARLKLIRQNSI